jgi:hypothetical protein
LSADREGWVRRHGIRRWIRRRDELPWLSCDAGKLSAHVLEFVGVDTWPINTPGWHTPTGLFLDLWSDLPEPSAEDSAVLHAIMGGGVNQERLKFLG